MKRGPDFICIGAAKAGTTWLANVLRQHPEISLKKKEIHFFEDRYSFYTKASFDNYKKGVEWYLKQLSFEEGKLTGDITPNYIWDEKCAKRIKKHFPSVKIIALLRNPVERAYSHYLHARRLFLSTKTFDEAVRKYPEFKERGLYYRQLKRYFDLFPRKNIKIILLDDIKKKPEKTLKDLEDFLEISYFIPDSIGNKVNPAKTPRFIFLNKFIGALLNIKKTRLGIWLWENKFFKKVKDKFTKLFIRIQIKEESQKPEIKPETRQYLLNYFKSDIEKLEKLIGRDLSSWKR